MSIQWMNILHFYQPPFQDSGILEKVTDECYLPVTKMLLKNPRAHCIVNINGCLLDSLREKVPRGTEVISNLAKLEKDRQIEITGTGKYHPIFPLIDASEIERQLNLQEESLKLYLGFQRKPEIVFLPEMAFLPEQAKLFQEQGYSWIIIDESSLRNRTSKMGQYKLVDRDSECRLLVRDREISESLGNSIWQKKPINNAQDFVGMISKKSNRKEFVITGTDVEVFGHHQKNRWRLLEEIYDNPSVKSILTADLAQGYADAEVDTVPSSWSTDKEDKKKNIYYPLWFHPENRLHRLLWQLLDIALDETRRWGTEHQNSELDSLLSSCPFFWASCRPWWNGMLVEKAADQIVQLLSEIQGISTRIGEIAELTRNRIYEEVSLLNETGKAVEIQNDFLSRHRLQRDSIESTLL
ncbi:MAG: hypothetical protein ACOYVJ_06575 [Nitrospirota bacterium]